MGKTTIDFFHISPDGREVLRQLLEVHHDDVWLCERTDLDDVGTERKSVYLDLTQMLFDTCKAWRVSRTERETPHR